MVDQRLKGPSQRPCVPFLKWAGGKRWLAERHLDLFPTRFSRYIEPFLGSGSVFFALAPNTSILADSNPRLIETYREVRDKPELVYQLLCHHQESHDNDYYYEERSREYLDAPAKRAAQFIYLNRTCWNGLYRVNRKGQFNVPRGTKSAVLLGTDDFCALSNLLANSELLCQDFAITMEKAGADDFVYVDPPYTVRHKYNGFTKYNERIFSWSDQIRLRDEVAKAIERGALVAVTNADHYSIRELYSGVGELRTLTRKSVIAAASRHRGLFDELLVMSWRK